MVATARIAATDRSIVFARWRAYATTSNRPTRFDFLGAIESIAERRLVANGHSTDCTACVLPIDIRSKNANIYYSLNAGKKIDTFVVFRCADAGVCVDLKKGREAG